MRRKRKYKKKKNNIFKRFFGIILSVLMFFIIAFSALYHFSPNFKIKGFEVIGGTTISQEEFKKEAQDLFTSSFNILGQEIIIDNIFLSFKNKTEELTNKFPEIENISIKKDFSKSIIYLEIKEKDPAVIWCNNQKCSLLDKKASFIRDYNNKEVFPMIEEKEEGDFKRIEIIKAVFKLEETIKQNNLKAEKYLLYSEKFIINNINGCDILFDLNNDFDWQLEKMETVLKQEKYINNLNNFEYIDLRFTNQVIVK